MLIPLIKNLIAMILIVILLTGTELASGQEPTVPYGICAKDQNDNGTIEESEVGECVKTAQGLLCMMDAVQCVERRSEPTCAPGGSLNTVTDKCEHKADIIDTDTYRCHPSYEYSPASKLCEAYPVCEVGVYHPGTDRCHQDVCPYGEAFPCHDFREGRYCSKLLCGNTALSTTDDSIVGGNDKADDGEMDAEGYCLGTLYLMNGNDQRCRSWGPKIGWGDCCKSSDYLLNTTQCKGSEISLAKVRDQGNCHYVGTYCSSKIKLLFKKVCVEKKKTYCCFGSKLSRILHEQGRPQLKTFGGSLWGSPKSPICRGFTVEEFEALDFSQINLDEYTGGITESSGSINEKAGEALAGGLENFTNSM